MIGKTGTKIIEIRIRMDRLLEHVIRSLYTIDEAYSPKVMKQLVDKFKLEIDDFGMDPVSDNDIEGYIKRFDQIKNSPKITEKDLLKWSISDLIRLVTASPEPSKSKEETNKEDDIYMVGGDTPVFENDKIQIFHGKDQDTCRILKSFDSNSGGSGEQWCIGRGSFSNYRFSDRRSNPSFYYIIDKEKFDNVQGSRYHSDFKFSFFVVQIRQDGEYVYTPRDNSPHESSAMGWSEISNIIPILSQENAQQYLKYIPLTNDEKLTNRYSRHAATTSEFMKFPFEMKKQYLVVRSTTGTTVNDLDDDDFVSKVLVKLPKLADFVSVNHGLVKKHNLLKHLELFSNNQAKSIIQNIRELEINDLSTSMYSWEVKKLLAKYSSDKFNFDGSWENQLWVSDDNKFIFLLQLSPTNFKLKAFTENETYTNVKVTPRTQHYLEKADLTIIEPSTILDLVSKGKLPIKQIPSILEKIKNNEVDGYSLKTKEGVHFVINTDKSLVYKIDKEEITNIPFDDPIVSNFLGKDFKKQALSAFTRGLSIGEGFGDFRGEGAFQTLRSIISTATIEERTIVIDGANSNRPVILFTSEGETANVDDGVHAIPTEITHISQTKLTAKQWDSEGRTSRYGHPPLSVIIQYFDYLRESNQTFTEAQIDVMFPPPIGTPTDSPGGSRANRNFFLSNPPMSPESNIILKHWEANDNLYFIDKTSKAASTSLSGMGKRINGTPGLTGAIWSEITGTATTRRGRQPAVAGEPAAPGAPRRGRPAGGGTNYNLEDLPVLDSENHTSAQSLITDLGLNWDGLDNESKFKLHNYTVARSPYNNRGVSRRSGQLPYNYQINNYYTVGNCAVYVIYRRVDLEEGGQTLTLAGVNIVIQPGNQHWMLVPGGATTRLTGANIASQFQVGVNEDINIKKFMVKEAIYQQKQKPMKISELQALVKEAIKEVMAENHPEQSPSEPDQGTETIPAPTTTPGRKTRRRKIGNPNADPNPKALNLEEAEKEIMNMITKRFIAAKDA